MIGRLGLAALALCALGCVCWVAAWAAEQPAQAGKVKALLVTGGHGYDHDAFMKIFDAEDLAVTPADPKLGSGVFDTIDDWKYDTVLLYNFSQPINEKQQANFRKLLEKGVGLFILHHASAAYPDWPEYEAIMGGRFHLKEAEVNGVKRPASGARGDVDFKVHVEDPGHPITRGLADFDVHDETYCKCYISPKVHVLLTTDEKSSDRAVAWGQAYGKARVFYLQLGHDNRTYTNKSFRTLVAQGLRWTAGRLPEGDLKPTGPAPAKDAG
jgi:type 1 glutamine amidotransferase